MALTCYGKRDVAHGLLEVAFAPGERDKHRHPAPDGLCDPEPAEMNGNNGQDAIEDLASPWVSS